MNQQIESLTKKCQENQEQIKTILTLLEKLGIHNTVNSELEKEKDKNKILEDTNKYIRNEVKNCNKEINRYKSNSLTHDKKPLSPHYYYASD